jgi:N6-L-threonylcarbamoyladenine synthase/protein kinase Bud32
LARALSVRHGKPLIGVNHCVAHLEVGFGVEDVTDPLLVYVSGANTQLIAQARGRFRVFGETLDVGLGNALDKFARGIGLSFPGGPEVERMALQASEPATLLPLPYAVKGMDLSFSGLATAAQRLVADGHAIPDVCHSLQEHAFAAVLETAERALAHTGKTELLLGGGVACNARLQAMARDLARERGLRCAIPPRDLLVDNGAMIAWLGLRALSGGASTSLAESAVRPYERTDDVAITWRPVPEATAMADMLSGAEAVLTPEDAYGRPALRKSRRPKAYRHSALDQRLRDERTRDEARLIAAARRAGVRVPVVLEMEANHLVLERLAGESLRSRLGAHPADGPRLMQSLGRATAALHDAGLVHGDLTTGNVQVSPTGALSLLDFGLGEASEEAEPHGVDLHIMEESLHASREDAPALWDAFLHGYKTGRRSAAALARLHDIRQRGRYK